MKTKLWLILVLGFITLAGSVTAQTGGRFPQLRQRIYNARLNEIARRMNLDQSVVEKLRPVYLNFEKEKAAIFNGSLRKNLETPADSLTDAEAEKIYFSQLEKGKKLIALREKYYHEFRQILSPRQILKFQRTEMEVNRKMLMDLKRRLNERFPGTERP